MQLGGVWLRLYQVTGDAALPERRPEGGRARGRAHQERGRWPAIDGALAGSFPVWGRYAPLQYPNWATKFLADSLMLREDCLPAPHESRPRQPLPARRHAAWKRQARRGLLDAGVDVARPVQPRALRDQVSAGLRSAARRVLRR